MTTTTTSDHTFYPLFFGTTPFAAQKDAWSFKLEPTKRQHPQSPQQCCAFCLYRGLSDSITVQCGHTICFSCSRILQDQTNGLDCPMCPPSTTKTSLAGKPVRHLLSPPLPVLQTSPSAAHHQAASAHQNLLSVSQPNLIHAPANHYPCAKLSNVRVICLARPQSFDVLVDPVGYLANRHTGAFRRIPAGARATACSCKWNLKMHSCKKLTFHLIPDHDGSCVRQDPV